MEKWRGRLLLQSLYSSTLRLRVNQQIVILNLIIEIHLANHFPLTIASSSSCGSIGLFSCHGEETINETELNRNKNPFRIHRLLYSHMLCYAPLRTELQLKEMLLNMPEK